MAADLVGRGIGISVFLFLTAVILPLPRSAAEGEDGLSYQLPEASLRSETENRSVRPGAFGFRRIAPFEAKRERSEPSATENVWGHFLPGSWVRYVRTVTTGTGTSSVTSETEIKYILKSVGIRSYTLERQVAVKIGGRELTRSPETIEYNFFDSAAGPELKLTEFYFDHIDLKLERGFSDTRTVPCCVSVFNRCAENRREETRIWYSPVIFPHLLREESRIFIFPENSDGKEKLYRYTVTDVHPGSLLGIMKEWVSEREEYDAEQRRVLRSVTHHSMKFPGGVSDEVTEEFDTEGKPVLRSELRIRDYSTVPR